MSGERVCSLLPSATEIVCALGLADQLVAITHECDYPPEVAHLPRVTKSVIDSDGMSWSEVDQAVRRVLANLSTIYQVDREALGRLQPDVILTQELCEVCAVSYDRVLEAAEAMCGAARVMSLEPVTLEGIFQSIIEVAQAVSAGGRAEALVRRLRQRVQTVRDNIAGRPRPRVLAMEWLNPVFTGGHWVPDMIEAAGGESLLARPGERSITLGWDEVAAVDPDLIVIMPCGYDLEATVRQIPEADLPKEFYDLRAVRAGEAYAVNGSAYFNRPGPRVVDGIEILARICHSEVFGSPNPEQAAAVGRVTVL